MTFLFFYYKTGNAQKNKNTVNSQTHLIKKEKLAPMDFDKRMKFLEPQVLPRVKQILSELKRHNQQLAIIIYKNERLLEIWTNDSNKKKLKEYKMTAFSGKLGPKNKQGDRQIPEGIYKTTFLHPNSKYYLSIKINYPNENDKKRATSSKIKDPGGEIFIHGDKVTIGCVPIGDHSMEELFFIVGSVGIKNTQVIIAPTKLPFPEFRFLNINPQDPLLKEKYLKLNNILQMYKPE